MKGLLVCLGLMVALVVGFASEAEAGGGRRSFRQQRFRSKNVQVEVVEVQRSRSYAAPVRQRVRTEYVYERPVEVVEVVERQRVYAPAERVEVRRQRVEVVGPCY